MCKIKKIKDKKNAFTLIELLVSISIFSIVMVIAIGALMMILDASRKAKTIKMIVNNLNVTLEGISREIRVGYDYTCGIVSFAGIVEGGSCNNNEHTSFGFHTKEKGGKALYKLENNAVYRWIDENDFNSENRDDGGFLKITSDDIIIDNFSFKVVGTGTGDSLQPRVMIRISGTATIEKFITKFNIQTTVSQRKLAP